MKSKLTNVYVDDQDGTQLQPILNTNPAAKTYERIKARGVARPNGSLTTS